MKKSIDDIKQTRRWPFSQTIQFGEILRLVNIDDPSDRVNQNTLLVYNVDTQKGDDSFKLELSNVTNSASSEMTTAIHSSLNACVG